MPPAAYVPVMRLAEEDREPHGIPKRVHDGHGPARQAASGTSDALARGSPFAPAASGSPGRPCRRRTRTRGRTCPTNGISIGRHMMPFRARQQPTDPCREKASRRSGVPAMFAGPPVSGMPGAIMHCVSTTCCAIRNRSSMRRHRAGRNGCNSYWCEPAMRCNAPIAKPRAPRVSRRCRLSTPTSWNRAAPNCPGVRRGQVPKSKAEKLHQALLNHQTEVLRFAQQAEVPFTGNRSERDLRMAKTRQKVSGCFRTRQHAEACCRVSSYLQTSASQGTGPLTAIRLALQGRALELLDKSE